MTSAFYIRNILAIPLWQIFNHGINQYTKMKSVPLKIAGKMPIRTHPEALGGGYKMSQSTRNSKSVLVDKRIEEFCQSSATLLETIHTKYGCAEKGIPPKKAKRRREKQIKAEEIEEEIEEFPEDE